MKIYNKKGLIGGILWTLLGFGTIISIFVKPDDFLPAQLKSLIVAIVLITIGVSSFTHAFSKKATREDMVQEHDERTRLIELKSKAKTLDIFVSILIVNAVGSMIGYGVTGNISWSVAALVSVCTITIYFIILLIATLYYENKE
jgi:hypothetical protein